jgi:hypothetical protein
MAIQVAMQAMKRKP